MKLDLKSLETLETKIQRMVDLVSRLREENSGLKTRLAELELNAAEGALRGKQVESMRVTQDSLERELKSLQEERKTVLAKVDSILDDLAKLQLD